MTGAERSEWFLGRGAGGEVHRAWPVILRGVWPLAAAAWTDLYPDPSWPQWHDLPPVAVEARAALLASEPSGKKNPGSGTDVPMTAEGLRLLSAWGSHSIHTEVTRSNGDIVLIAHDGGWLSADLSAGEASAVRAALVDAGAELEWLAPEVRPSWWRRTFRRS